VAVAEIVDVVETVDVVMLLPVEEDVEESLIVNLAQDEDREDHFLSF